MENITNKLLKLESGKNYLILRQAAYRGKTYFLCAEVSEDGESFLNQFSFLEKVESEQFKVKEVIDKEVLEILANNIKID